MGKLFKSRKSPTLSSDVQKLNKLLDDPKKAKTEDLIKQLKKDKVIEYLEANDKHCKALLKSASRQGNHISLLAYILGEISTNECYNEFPLAKKFRQLLVAEKSIPRNEYLSEAAMGVWCGQVTDEQFATIVEVLHRAAKQAYRDYADRKRDSSHSKTGQSDGWGPPKDGRWVVENLMLLTTPDGSGFNHTMLLTPLQFAESPECKLAKTSWFLRLTMDVKR